MAPPFFLHVLIRNQRNDLITSVVDLQMDPIPFGNQYFEKIESLKSVNSFRKSFSSDWIAHPQQSSSHVRYEIQEDSFGGKGESGCLAAYSFCTIIMASFSFCAVTTRQNNSLLSPVSFKLRSSTLYRIVLNTFRNHCPIIP